MKKSEIDLLKGLGIALVVIGHCVPPEALRKFIFGFHMPLFFMISGYLFDVEKWHTLGIKELVKRKIKAYIIPYFILCFLNLPLNAIVEYLYGSDKKALLASVLRRIGWIFYSYAATDKMPNCSSLWFLPALFIACILFYFIMKIGKPMGRHILLLFFAIVVFVISPYYSQCPWHIDSACIGVGFMYVGNRMRDWKERGNSISVGSSIVLLIIGVYAVFTNGTVDMNTNVYSNLLLFEIGGCVLSVLCFELAFRLRTNKLLEFWGRNTIIFMAFHTFIISLSIILKNRYYILEDFDYAWWVKSIVGILGCSIIALLWETFHRREHKIK
jgi:fucose 4-O-acetylase-like acetyltransferase